MYKEYSDDQLYNQLSYIDNLLDSQKMKQVDLLMLDTEKCDNISFRMKTYSVS